MYITVESTRPQRYDNARIRSIFLDGHAHQPLGTTVSVADSVSEDDRLIWQGFGMCLRLLLTLQAGSLLDY
jgi:hypothetical protein